MAFFYSTFTPKVGLDTRVVCVSRNYDFLNVDVVEESTDRWRGFDTMSQRLASPVVRTIFKIDRQPKKLPERMPGKTG